MANRALLAGSILLSLWGALLLIQNLPDTCWPVIKRLQPNPDAPLTADRLASREWQDHQAATEAIQVERGLHQTR